MYFDTERRSDDSAEQEILSRLEDITEKAPRYNVVLLDDNDHTYDYVIEMLVELFGHSRLRSFEMACEVDYRGRVVVFTGEKEEADTKKQQILNYGPDWRLTRSRDSMKAVVEPVK